MVAVLLAVRDRYDELTADDLAPDVVDVDERLTATAPGDLRAFLATELDEDPDPRDRFLAFVGENPEKSVTDYKREIDRPFDDVAGRRGLVEYDTRIDFSEYYDLATAYREGGDPGRALSIYRALAETIRANIDRIDDSAGYYSDQLERAVDGYVGCLRERELTAAETCEYVTHFHEQVVDTGFEFVQRIYLDALGEVCATDATLEHWRDLLEESLVADDALTGAESDSGGSNRALRSTGDRRAHVLSAYADVLAGLDDADSLRSFLDDVYLESRDLCRRYGEHLIDAGDDEKAITVVEDGLDEFRRAPDLARLATDVYRNRNLDRARELLETRFFEYEDWDAYDELRDLSSTEEWETTYHRIVSRLGRTDRQRLVDLYLHEGDREKALSTVLDSEDLDLLQRYRSDLGDVDPERYFDTYREQLEPFAADTTGRSHYRTVIGHLEEIEALGMDEAFDQFVEHLQEKHSNRPAFLNELEKAGY